MNRTASRTAEIVRAAATGEPIPHRPGELGIVVDSREQRPWTWGCIPVKVRALPAGDYSIIGHETEIAIERKTLDDLIASIRTLRFRRELEKLAGYKFAAVVIEASEDDVRHGRYHADRDPESILRTVASFEIQYRVPFVFAGSRARAHAWALRHLMAFFDARRFA